MIWKYALYAASAGYAGVGVLHVIGGGASVAAPLLRSELGPEARYLGYYAWHVVTIAIFACAGAAFFAAWLKNAALAWLTALLGLAWAALAGVVIVAFALTALTVPLWILFAPIGALCAVGALGLQRGPANS